MRPSESRSPLQVPPRPLPGQSVHNSIIDLVFVRLLAPLWIASTLSVIAILESLATLGHWRRAPEVYAALAGVTAAFCALQFWSNHREIKQRQQGRDGERLVAESLDELRALGASVFHDVPAALELRRRAGAHRGRSSVDGPHDESERIALSSEQGSRHFTAALMTEVKAYAAPMPGHHMPPL